MCTDYPKQEDANAVGLLFDRSDCSLSTPMKWAYQTPWIRLTQKKGRREFMQRWEMQDTRNANEIHHVTSDRPVHSFIYIASPFWPSKVGLWWSVFFQVPCVYWVSRVKPLRPQFVIFDQMLNYRLLRMRSPFRRPLEQHLSALKKAFHFAAPSNYLKWG